MGEAKYYVKRKKLEKTPLVETITHCAPLNVAIDPEIRIVPLFFIKINKYTFVSCELAPSAGENDTLRIKMWH